MEKEEKLKHIPVLLNKVVEQFDHLRNIDEGYFVDGTIGAGGHSLAMMKTSKIIPPINLPLSKGERKGVRIIGIDKDKEALEITQNNIETAGLADNFTLVHDDFKNIKKILADLRIAKIAGALIDLGVSSMQFDQAERGFSFRDPVAPLDMRMDQTRGQTAADILNSWNQQKIADLLLEIGEEKYARAIARNITLMRQEKPFRIVGDLLDVLIKSIPPKARYDREKHFATNTFRALRIAVNDELLNLDRAIKDFVDLLQTGGKLAVITFHSNEDRIIKNTMKELENPCVCPPDLPACVCGRKPAIKILTKKPITPGEDEVATNPRARSAKLRVVEKL